MKKPFRLRKLIKGHTWVDFGKVNKEKKVIDIGLRRIHPYAPTYTSLHRKTASPSSRMKPFYQFNSIQSVQGEDSMFADDSAFQCLQCAEGCDDCEDSSPCIVTLNWVLRTILLILQCIIICCLPIVVLFTYKYKDIKVYILDCNLGFLFWGHLSEGLNFPHNYISTIPILEFVASELRSGRPGIIKLCRTKTAKKALVRSVQIEKRPSYKSSCRLASETRHL